MPRIPVRCMTGLAVAARCKGLGIGAIRRYQAAVYIMTGTTCVMRLRIPAGKRCCCMTVEAARGADYCY